MSLIPPPTPRPIRHNFNLSLNDDTMRLLRQYAAYLGATREHVIQEALRYIAKRDRAFQTWLLTHDSGSAPHYDESLRPTANDEETA
jgi:hypothetical protein